MKKIRVLVVDEQTVVREGIAAILRDYSDIEVIGQAEDGLEAVGMAQQRLPDVILMDPIMQEDVCLEAIPELRKLLPSPKILLLTSYYDGELVRQAIRAGALGCVLKDASLEELLEAIRKVALGKASLHPSIAMTLIQQINSQDQVLAATSLLTPREAETLRFIAQGLSNQEIAAGLYVHERTVAKYVSNILAKLNLANRTQAALYAVRMEARNEPATRPREAAAWGLMQK